MTGPGPLVWNLRNVSVFLCLWKLHEIIDQLDLIDIYRTLHPKKTPEYIFFSSTHGMFSGIDSILSHKTSLSKFKRIEIISRIFSDYNFMKLESNHRKKNRKRMNTWRLNNMLLKNQWVNDVIKEEIRKYIKTSENENTILKKNLWDTAKAVLRGKFIAVQAFFRNQEILK